MGNMDTKNKREYSGGSEEYSLLMSAVPPFPKCPQLRIGMPSKAGNHGCLPDLGVGVVKVCKATQASVNS